MQYVNCISIFSSISPSPICHPFPLSQILHNRCRVQTIALSVFGSETTHNELFLGINRSDIYATQICIFFGMLFSSCSETAILLYGFPIRPNPAPKSTFLEHPSLDSLSSSVEEMDPFLPVMVSTIIGMLLGGEEYNVDPYGLGYFQGSFAQLFYGASSPHSGVLLLTLRL